MDLPRLPDGYTHRPVMVGYSGGLDSTVLLRLLASSEAIRGNGLRAIHVHHGLHADADQWAAHCRRNCDALGIELVVARVEVDADAGHGLEGAARKARHAAFEAGLRDGEVLALAHHQDDQAETFLLRALRASGPDGLAAMRPWRRCARGWLWRPLLSSPRDALLAFAQENKLSWIDDPSNASTDLDRGFLRHRVLPLLRERWSHVGASLSQVARLQQDVLLLFESGGQRALASSRTLDPQVLSVPALRALPAARRARVLRQWITGLLLPPLSAQGIAHIETELLPAGNDSEARFEWSGAVIHRWRDLLHAGTASEPLPPGWSAPWAMEEPLRLPGGGQLALLEGNEASPAGAAPAPALPCQVHARRGGERITLPGRDHSHALKHVLQDLGVPPWERARLPLLSDRDGTLLAAGDLAYSAGFDAWLRARGARLAWTRM